jgi:hypothetical protein
MLSLMCIWATQKLSLHEQRTYWSSWLFAVSLATLLQLAFAPYQPFFGEGALPSQLLPGLLLPDVRLKAASSLWHSVMAGSALALLAWDSLGDLICPSDRRFLASGGVTV